MNTYTNSVNLPSEMYEFGTYRLTYEPPQGALESTIDMSISAEADLEQVTEFFTSFLRAAGYPIDYSEVLEVTDPEGDAEEKVSFSSNGFPGYPDVSITSVFPGVAVGNPPARNVFF